MAPVPLPDLSKVKSDMRPIAATIAAKLSEANDRLEKSRAWYEGLGK